MIAFSHSIELSSQREEPHMQEYLSKLNRLRVNAGKKELKSWKAGKDAILDAIDKLEKAGVKDVLPGANVEAAPQTNDPEVAKVIKDPPPQPEPKKIKPGLGRGLGDEKYAVHSRKAVQDHRRDERKALKDLRKGKKALSDEDLEQVKKEAELRKGEVDPKKDPAKAARQKKHIEEKQAARKAAGKKPTRKEVGKDEITVADIARELGIDPKIARAKLRRHEDKLTKLHSKGQDRWVFPKSAAADIKKILK